MIQGTASSVGKSVIAAALCRIFMQDGLRPAPFKSQNMALNSYVSSEGLEMGRAQAMQAMACGIEPSVLMNPILLKPTGESVAQVVVNGKPFKNMSAAEYHAYKPRVRSLVAEAYAELCGRFDVIVIEGAGSPAEINLRDNDIVNMGMAEIADAPVILAADIDRGGVFASIVGTLALLREEEKLRVKGVIINKFRGDINILKPGIKMLEDIIHIPVLGVIPHAKISLEDEDSVTEKFNARPGCGDITIAVVKLPRISNFTDFDALEIQPDVSLRFVESPADCAGADMLIIPGSKNTIADLAFIRAAGFDKKIFELHSRGVLIAGICGGYQMLGSSIDDPYGVEGSERHVPGLGLIGVTTVLEETKVTVRVKGSIAQGAGFLEGLEGLHVEGYEIHMGRSTAPDAGRGLVVMDGRTDGYAKDGVLGSYIHGLFDSGPFTRGLLNNLRKKKGLGPLLLPEGAGDYKIHREDAFNQLADIVRAAIDMDAVYAILNGGPIAVR